MIELHIPADAPSDLYITEALDARPARHADYVRESKLIQALAVRMIDEPETVLPKFVEAIAHHRHHGREVDPPFV